MAGSRLAMRLLLHIVAAFVLLASGSLLIFFVRMRAQGRRVMAEMGSREAIPRPLGAWLIVVAWTMVFCAALAALIAMP
jgi:hypothetical protein